MKFSPTATLAFALATGLAGAAMAQTTPTPNAAPTNPQPAAQNVQANWQPGQANPNVAQPQAGTTQRQPASGQTQAGAQPQPATGQAPPDQMRQGLNTQPASQPSTSGNEQVRQAQHQLQAAGLYNGPVDGMMDPDTRAALARFQQQHGLRRTQDLDPATMSRLMSSQTTGSGTSAAAPTPAPNNGQPTSPRTGNTPGQAMGR